MLTRLESSNSDITAWAPTLKQLTTLYLGQNRTKDKQKLGGFAAWIFKSRPILKEHKHLADETGKGELPLL